MPCIERLREILIGEGKTNSAMRELYQQNREEEKRK